MARDRRHFTLSGIGKARPSAAKTGGSSRHPRNVKHREAHAQALLTALDHLPNITENNLPGVYLAIEGRPHELMVTKSLNDSGLTLLKVQKQRDDGGDSVCNATPFIAPSKTMGAVIPDSLSAPVNVVVFQWPCETGERHRSPQGPVREAETSSCSGRFHR